MFVIIIFDDVYLEKFGVWGLVIFWFKEGFGFWFFDRSFFKEGFEIIWLIS